MASKELTHVCEMEVKYSRIIKPSQRPKIVTSQEAYDLFMDYWDQDLIQLMEQFVVLYLNWHYRVIGIMPVTIGTAEQVQIDARRIFGGAIRTKARNLILSHNHPSGNRMPSNADIAVTQRLSKGAKVLNMKILDHIIVTPNSYYSFRDMGEHQF